jgi:hypothetical protein
MRVLTCGIIIALLFTSLHVLVDHGAGEHKSFALIPHPCPSHVHSDDEHPAAHHDHDHEGKPAHGHDPYHHQADTHSHFAWYISADAKIAPHLAPSVFNADIVMVRLSITGTSSLCGGPSAPPPRGPLVYLQCSVLRI